MRVPSTEIQNNFGKYLNIAYEGEKVVVTKNGKDFVELLSCENERIISEKAGEYMVGAKGKITYEEFIEMTEKSDERYELIDGEIFLLTSPNYHHQIALSEIFGRFYNWFKGKNCRPLTAPFDVTLTKSNDNKNVVQPDIIVICDTDRIDEKKKYKGIPTLVVEILSESNKRHDMVRKLGLYMQTGIKEYWMIDPVKREIYIHTFEGQDISDYRTYSGSTIVKSSIFEGLEIPLQEIFDY